MKEIKAQLSSDFLQYILPLNAIDNSRDALTRKESNTLYELWKNGKRVDGKIMRSNDVDRIVLIALKNKGYILSDDITIEFTKKGKEIIKKIILGTEDNIFKKKAN